MEDSRKPHPIDCGRYLLTLLTQTSGSDVVVVDYWATWCGPCKMISPHFAKLEGKFPNVKFAKVDVEEQEVRYFPLCSWMEYSAGAFLQDIAKEAQIKAMPTFVAYKDGKVIETVTGAVPAKINVGLYLFLRRRTFG